MLTRRGFVLGSLSTASSLAAACGAPGPAVATRRPRVSHGVQAGDVETGRALVWARADEPARMIVEWDTSPRFASPRRVAGPVVTPETDLAASVALTGLPDGQTISYRVRFEREAARGTSEWALGRFATPRPDRLRVAWTGDTCGQGWGRNPEWGGLRGYAAMRAAEPSLFIHSGDLMYADNPILAEQRTPDGRIWRNITNERVARVAESLDDFRARYAYNRDDEHVRAFSADVPVIAQWDDHETRNNWWPGQQLDDARYRERDASLLAARALRATREWNPIPPGPVHRVLRHGPLLDVIVLDCRSFRSPNSDNLGASAAMLGPAQAAWLAETLAASRARWKIVACDQPISLVIPDDAAQEGWANGDPGPPMGRERELASVLRAVRGTRNIVWVTADVHYAAAHHFDPARVAGRGSGGGGSGGGSRGGGSRGGGGGGGDGGDGGGEVEFAPFWELVAGPIHAGTFGPSPLDPSLGGEVRFQWAPPPGAANLPPWDGLQSFGTLDVTPEAITAALWGIDGDERYRVEIAWEG